MGFQLEQNLYSIYRIVLKLPRWILLAALLLLAVIASTQFANINSNNRLVDFSDCMFNYLIQKHNSTTAESLSSTAESLLLPLAYTNQSENGTSVVPEKF